jgi:hypothetical protein
MAGTAVKKWHKRKNTAAEGYEIRGECGSLLDAFVFSRKSPLIFILTPPPPVCPYVTERPHVEKKKFRQNLTFATFMKINQRIPIGKKISGALE